jgi:hypothetical protein
MLWVPLFHVCRIDFCAFRWQGTVICKGQMIILQGAVESQGQHSFLTLGLKIILPHIFLILTGSFQNVCSIPGRLIISSCILDSSHEQYTVWVLLPAVYLHLVLWLVHTMASETLVSLHSLGRLWGSVKAPPAGSQFCTEQPSFLAV